jgi:uncharacterized protein YcfL
MLHVKRIALAAPALLLMSVACSLGCRSGFESGVTPIGDPGRTTQVTTGDTWIRSKVEIRNVRSQRRQDQRLDVQFELYNAWHNPMSLRYSVTWFDARGMLISTSDVYKEAEILGEQSLLVNVTGPNDRATNWQVDLQPLAER